MIDDEGVLAEVTMEGFGEVQLEVDWREAD